MRFQRDEIELECVQGYTLRSSGTFAYLINFWALVK